MQGWSLVEAKLGSCTPCSVRTGPLTSKTALMAVVMEKMERALEKINRSESKHPDEGVCLGGLCLRWLKLQKTHCARPLIKGHDLPLHTCKSAGTSFSTGNKYLGILLCTNHENSGQNCS